MLNILTDIYNLSIQFTICKYTLDEGVILKKSPLSPLFQSGVTGNPTAETAGD
jgi:hypothetical protein